MQTPNTSWQAALSNAITDPVELIALLDLPPHFIVAAQKAAQQFPLRVPRGFVVRMKKGNSADPLLRQVLPLDLELQEVTDFSSDPLNEKVVNPIPGLLHKYHGRVLLTVVGTCGVNCRYCFRRHFPYAENNPGFAGWDEALAYIAKDSSVQEVILSGGDPLVASDAYLAKLYQKIAAIPHVKTLRIHSRLPIVLPERITPEFISWFTGGRLRPVLVVHCNHPQEIDDNVQRALRQLQPTGITLLNQSVLLAGVNDSVAVLVALSEALFTAGVLPYYLHKLDQVHGAAHFAVREKRAQELFLGVLGQLPGYLVPKWVQEVPGAPAKLPMVLLDKFCYHWAARGGPG